jgi:hypothetical protein
VNILPREKQTEAIAALTEGVSVRAGQKTVQTRAINTFSSQLPEPRKQS